MAGKEWLFNFRKRHPILSIRTPEPTSIARAKSFNEHNVSKFFDLLESLPYFPPTNIYNCDETGITTVQSKPSKILSVKGKKQVGTMTSAERGELATVEICMSAAGHFVPPFIIFPRVRMRQEFMDGAPPGSAYACHASGWMQSDIFVQWFEHFQRFTKPTAEDPVLYTGP